MVLKNATIHNFGKLQGQQFDFSPGINLIYGENESGKTTLHSFLMGMLFGVEKSRGKQSREEVYGRYEPWNSSSYYAGSLQFVVEGKDFLLERNFYHKEKSARLLCLSDQEELAVEHGDLSMLLGGITKEGYENTYGIRQAGFLADDSLSIALENYMADVSNTGDGSVRIQLAMNELIAKKKEAAKKGKLLLAQREEKIKALTMEAELLKKDIAFQKNSELSSQLHLEKERKEKDAREKEERAEADRLLKKKINTARAVTVMAMAATFLGIILVFLGDWARNVGLIILVCSLFLHLFRYRMGRPQEVGMQQSEKNSFQESINEITELWKEKENRFYNIEEELQELSQVSPEEKELKEQEKAYDLALLTIESLAKEIHEEISDDLHAAVSRNLSKITRGKYDSILMDENLKVSILEDGKNIPVHQLSRGTLEQTYLAMRMGVGDILMKQEPMPLLFDETFSMYDDHRLKETIQWLSEYPGQILLFSCQKRELDCIRELGLPVQVIRLSN